MIPANTVAADPVADVTKLRRDLWAGGYRPVAVCNHDAPGNSPGKRPVGLEWQRRAMLDPPEAAAQPASAHARNTGILCSGLRAVDVDFDDPVTASEIWTLADIMFGQTIARTRPNSGKLLLLYRAAEGEPSKRTLSADGGKIEILGHGQQFVAFGRHASGADLQWCNGSPLTRARGALPAVTEDQVTAFLGAAREIVGQATAHESAPADARASAFGKTGEIADIESAVAVIPNDGPADWNHWTRIGMAIWAATEGDEAGLEIWRAWSEQHPDFDPDATEERWAHFGDSPPSRIGAGTLIGLAKQHEPDWRQPSRASMGGAEFSSLPDEPGQRRSNLDRTEDGLALAFCDEYAGRFVYDHTARKWWRWHGERWTRDARGSVFHAARGFLRDVRDTGGGEASLGRIAVAGHVEQASRSDPRMAVDQSVWDTDPWLLGVPGGIVDLRTGAVRPNRPDLYIGRQTAVAPAPVGTPAPLWRAFLADATQGDADVQAFLQRLAGYMLTGDVSEEVIAFLHGPGGNGKGVFLGALLTILADYAVTVPIGVLTVGGRENPEYYRAKMAGARVVTASETEAGAIWAESQVKELTGNEAPISARSPYGDPFEFRAQFKLVIVGNHTPHMKGRSPAMERRLRIVPFVHKPASPDPDLKTKLRAEYPAILRWTIDGCLVWQRERLGTAPAITAATGEYFESQDTVAQWAAERCDAGTECSAKPGELLADFTAWARSNAVPALSRTDFKEAVRRIAGARYAILKGKDVVRGLALRSDAGVAELLP